MDLRRDPRLLADLLVQAASDLDRHPEWAAMTAQQLRNIAQALTTPPRKASRHA